MLMNTVEMTNDVTLNPTMYQLGLSRMMTSSKIDVDTLTFDILESCF